MKPDTIGRTPQPNFTISIVKFLAMTTHVNVHFMTFSFMIAEKGV